MAIDIQELKRDAAELEKRAERIVDEADGARRDLTGRECDVIAEYRGQAKSLRSMAERLRDEQSADNYEHARKAGLPVTKPPMRVPQPSDGHFGAGADALAVTTKRWWKADADHLDDGGFASFSDYLRAVRGTASARFDDRLEAFAPAAGQSTGEGAAGGFLVPDRFEAEVLQTADGEAPWLDRRTTFEIGAGQGNSITMPVLDDRDRSGGDIAGARMPRTPEGGELDKDTIRFKSRSAKLKKAASLAKVTNELLEDAAVGVDTVLFQTFARRVQLRRALDFLDGTGAGEPKGILKSDAVFEVAKEDSQAADTVVYENVVNMFARLTPGAMGRAVWLAHSGTFPQLATMTLGDKPIWLANATARPRELLGLPIFYHESLHLLGDRGDLLLVDPAAYLYVAKRLRVELAPQHSFNTDEVSFRVVMRDDGSPLHNSTLTDARGYEVSEFIALAARD